MSVKEIYEDISKHDLDIHQRMALVQLLMGCEFEGDDEGNIVLCTKLIDDAYSSNGVILDEVWHHAHG